MYLSASIFETCTLKLAAGTLNTASFTISAYYFDLTGTSTRSLTCGTSLITNTDIDNNESAGNGYQWDISTSTNMSLNAASATFNIKATGSASLGFAGGGFSYGPTTLTLPQQSGTAWVMLGANTFSSLTIVNRAGWTSICAFAANQTITGAFTTTNAGTAGINRIGIYGYPVQTARTLTAGSVSLTDTDFFYITGAGTASWTGTRIGNAGGNTNITPTTAKTVYWNNTGGTNWNSATAWAATSGGATASTNYPLPQDTAVFSNTGTTTGMTVSQASNITTGSNGNYSSLGVPSTPLYQYSPTSIVATGMTNLVTFASYNISNTAFTNCSTITISSPKFIGINSLQMTGANYPVYTGTVIIEQPPTATGVISLGQNWTTSGSAFTITQGNFSTNGFSFTNTASGNFTFTAGRLTITNTTLSVFNFSSNNNNTRVINFGTTGNITLNSSGTPLSINGSNLTHTGTPTVNVTPQALKTVFITSGTTYTIPADFVSFVSVEAIGAGAGSFRSAGAGGGGGGAYSKSTSVTGLTAGGTAYVSIGAGGAAGAPATSGGDTWFNTTNTPPSVTTTGVLAKGGTAATGTSGGNGGATGTGVGDLKNSGGSGGVGNATTFTKGGGGSAAGPVSTTAGNNGGTGGNGGITANFGSGGGAGAPVPSFGARDGRPGTVSAGGAGGNFSGQTAGSGATSSLPANNTAPTNGAGGGGGFSSTNINGGVGSTGNFWTATAGGTAGPGGGGGGAGGGSAGTSATGGAGALYGGGAGGSSASSTGAASGGSGIVVFTYVSSDAPTLPVTLTTNSGFTETNAFNFNLTTGTYTLTVSGTSVFRNLNFTGFAGTWASGASQYTFYGNLTLVSGMTYTTPTGGGYTFANTSGTATLTSAGKTLYTIIMSGLGGTLAFSGATTISTLLTFSNGTLQLPANLTTTVGSFTTSGTTLKFLTSSSAGTQATIAKASGTTTVTYLSIQDSNATGGTWDASAVTNVNVSNNTGWTFASVAGSGNFFLLF
jgi:hypothetical protein